MACEQQIKFIKVFASLDGLVVDNGLTLDGQSLQFRGPLVRTTEITGNQILSFGLSTDKLNQFNVETSNQLSLRNSSIDGENSLLFNNSGILVSSTIPNARGLEGASNFSANADNLSFIQKIYADNRVVGKEITATLAAPDVGQDSFAITWNNTEQKFDLTPSGTISAGADTQVIFNSANTLIGNARFTFIVGTGVLSVPEINLGATTPIGGNNRIIQVISDVSNTGIEIRPKGTGSIVLGILDGSVTLGASSSANTVQVILASGAGAQVDISLEPKGTEGKVFIGNANEAGAYRYIQARGSVANVNLHISGKGTGSVILDSNLNVPTFIGHPVDSIAYRSLKAGSSAGTSDLGIGGHGDASKVFIGDRIGSSTIRYLQADSTATNVDLRINGKGTGLVAVNDVVNYKKVQIGDWNMDVDGTISIFHGLPSYKKIISVRVVIRDDNDDVYYPLDTMQTSGEVDGGITNWWNATISMWRRVGGVFDAAAFNATGYNRGWLYISYEI